MKRIFIFLISLLAAGPLFGEQLYFEDFSTGAWPTGYTYEGNWQISSLYEGNDSPPAAIFNWSPQQTDFEHHMYTSAIDVGENTSVYVEFYFALDFYGQGQLNGLKIAYDGGNGWVDVLNYSIGPGLLIQDNPWTSTESFTADITAGTDLKIRWTAYGADSWAIDGWIVDNIKVLTLPKLTSVNIASANEDPATASTGTNVWLNFTSNTVLSGTPYVQINGTACNVDNLGGNNWVAYYTVLATDSDGPLQFTINFTDADGLGGSTVKETTDGSTVIVDNSDPPRFTVGTVTSLGGNVFSEIWNSTNTNIQLEVNVPQDSAVNSFNYYESSSLSFNGTSNKLQIPGNASYQVTNALTVEIWVKPNGVPSDYDGFMDYGKDDSGIQAGFGFSFFLTGWRFFLKTTSNVINYSGMAEAQMPVGQWTHMAATYDGDEVKIYRNGTLVDSVDATGNIQWTGIPSELTLGKYDRDGSSYYFNGQLDDFRIWNVVRTKDQINASKEIYVSVDEAGLLGYWQMDDGSGTSTADSTANANHATISGATWVIQDSPVDLKTPIYDTGVIIGSAFQLRGRVATNEFAGFDSKDTITLADYNAGTKIVSATEATFEAITGYAHGETAQLSAFLFDVAGNYSLGDTSTTNTVIDLVANSSTPVSISSNNTFTHLAKTGDVVTITMAYDEDVETPSVTVDGNDADDVSDLGSEQFSSTYTLTGSEAEGDLPFTINATDYLGNPGTHLGSTDGSTVVYDKTIPTLSPVSIASNNADTTWAKANDSISVTFTSSEEISADFALSFDGIDDYIELPDGMVSSLNDFTFICWFNTNINDPWTRLMDFGSSTAVNMFLTPSHNGTNIPRFAIKQSGGGEQQITSSLSLNQGQWYHIAVTIDDNTNTGKMYLDGTLIAENNSMTTRPSSLGNTTNNYFGKSQYNDPYLDGMMDDISIWERPLDQNEIQSSMYTSFNGDENGLISYWGFNEGSGSVAYDQSSNGNDGDLTNMDLTSAWFFKKGSGPTATIMSQNANISTINSNQFRADYTTTATDPEGDVQFGIIFADPSGNDGETVISTTNNSRVIFDRTAPVDFTLGIVTANGGNMVENAWNSTNTGLDVTVPVESDTTLKNGWIQVWTKVGINAFEKLGDSTIIANSDVGTEKVISFTSEQVEAITGFAEEDTLTIKAIMSDRPGNETVGSQSINRLVIDQVLPTVLSSHIESNNPNTTKAKVGDIITLSFQTDEIIQVPTATISVQAATITDLGSLNWSGIYTMQETDDEGVIPFTVDALMDARGNPANGFTTPSDGSQVIFDRTKPELDQVQAQTNNTWNNLWALEDEYAKLYVNASEDLLSINCTFNGLVTTDNQYGPDEYDLGYTFSNTDTEGLIAFEIVFVDSAGNKGDTIRASTDNTYIVFDKTAPSGFTVGNISATGGNVVATFWNSTNTGLDVIVPIESDTTLDSGRVQIWAKVRTNAFEMLGDSSFILSSEVGSTKSMSIPGSNVRSITGYAENDIISLKAFIFDIPGNEKEGAESSIQMTIDETLPVLSYISYKSNFTDTTLATVGHEITLTLIASENIEIPTATISTNISTILDLNNNRWSATYTMQDTDTDGIIPFEVGALTDIHGNPANGATLATDGSTVTFDNTKPTLTLVSILSNNEDTTWAKVGDTISVNFTGNELLTEQSGTIVTQTAEIITKYKIFDDNKSINFDGIDDYGYLANFNNIPSSTLTITAWIKTTSNGIIAQQGRSSIDADTEYFFQIKNGKLNFWDWNGSAGFDEVTNFSNANVNTGEWIHVCFVKNGTNGKYYINGTLDNTVTAAFDASYSANDFVLGKDYRDSNKYFAELMDEVSVWNTELNESEIQNVMYGNLTGAEEGLVGYWTFNEGSGNTLNDLSSSGNDISLNGPLWESGSPIDKYYLAKYTMTATDPEGVIAFDILVTDSVGLVSDPVTETTDETAVIFDRTAPTLTTVHIESNNSNNTSIAIGGDDISLLFTPIEPLIIDSIIVTIAGQTATVTFDGTSYLATITLTGAEDDGLISYTIDMADRAGNAGIQVIETTDDSYVNHDVLPPELESISIASSSLDSTWAKVGDSVFVTFTASEVLDNITITIAGVSSSYSDLGVARYRAYYEMTEANDEGVVTFTLTYTDLGGSAGPDENTTTNNTQVQFDKTAPQFSNTQMATNNVFGDSLAGIGTVNTLSFSISEPYLNLNVLLSDAEKTLTENGLNFSTSHTFSESDTEGWVPFSIAMMDSAGNMADTLTATQNGSVVRFDGTHPTLPFVTFFSSNNQDSTLCLIGDSLFLQYTSAETLRSSSIKIGGNLADREFYSNNKYNAVYGMTGTEEEGFIPFTITDFLDWVGNVGDSVTTSTNGSTVLFDMTPPEDFTLGNVIPENGIVVTGFWNASNQTLNLIIPIANDETLPDGGFQLWVSFGGDFTNLTDTISIVSVDLGTNKTILVSAADFESATGYLENTNATFRATLWDKAGNSTTGSISASTIHIDETIPELIVVTQVTNNAIADSLAKVGDIDTLTFSSTEGLDSLAVQILNQDAVQSGSNMDWNSTYSFQDSDNDGLVTFNIVFGDTAGNLGTDISGTTDGSTVRFDGTNPTLINVSFTSTNVIDPGLAVIGDSLFLDFVSDENLLSTSVSIAGEEADTTIENQGRTPYRSWRILNGNEPEGLIPFEIGFTDLVGNRGDTSEVTSDNTSILFDMTPPADFELDTVIVSGGTVIYGYWNTNNDTILLKVPVPIEDETLIGGVFQPQIRFGENDYINIGAEIQILDELETPFQELAIPRLLFTAMDDFAEDVNVLFTSIARDRAGNETIGTTDNTILHIDETAPEISDISMISDNAIDTTWAKIGNTVSLQFLASEGLSFSEGIIQLDTLTLNSALNGTELTLSKIMDENDEEGELSFSIAYKDTAGNWGELSTNTTVGGHVQFDKTNPSISNLLEGMNGEDINYYNQSDSITIYWDHDDELAGVRDVFVALGTDSNTTDIVDWTLSGNDPFYGLSNLSLSNDGIYFGGAFVRDSSGNHSDTIWGNSVYIDTENPDSGSIIDGYWVMDLDYSIDSTRLSYIWSNFTDNTEIDYYELAIGTGNDTSNTMDWMRSDSTDSMTVTGLSLVRDTLYYSYIKAIDLASNKSMVVKTDGIYFDDSFPMVDKITPNVVSDSAGYLSILSNDTVTVKFNRPIYDYNLQVTSNVETDFLINHSYGDSVITVIWGNTLSSYDTITIFVDSAQAFNTLYVSDTLTFYSQLWGDLNSDYDLTVEDILLFNQQWPAIDLGPFTDDPPHVRPEPDGEANLTDLAAFGQMWQWKYFNLAFDTSLFALRSTQGLDIIAQGNKVKIGISKNVAMAEILIGESNLDIEKMTFKNPSGSAFMFTAMDTANGLKQFSMADSRGFDTTLTLWLPETEMEYFQAQIQYRLLNKEGIVLEMGVLSVDIDILPDKFTVYDNYPNPFNPVTTIRYDLPDIRNIDIIIYDILGRTVRRIEMSHVRAGRHKFVWQGINDLGKRVSTGIYFLQLTAGKDIKIQKMLLLK